jgi:transposase-like protein
MRNIDVITNLITLHLEKHNSTSLSNNLKYPFVEYILDNNISLRKAAGLVNSHKNTVHRWVVEYRKTQITRVSLEDAPHNFVSSLKEAMCNVQGELSNVYKDIDTSYTELGYLLSKVDSLGKQLTKAIKTLNSVDTGAIK